MVTPVKYEYDTTMVSTRLQYLQSINNAMKSFAKPSVRCEQYFDGEVQDCSISSANTLEILQSCTKASISTGQQRF